MRQKLFLTWNMARKLKITENEKCTLYDLEYAEKTETHGKGETHTVGHEIWPEILKNEKNEKNTLQDQDYGEKIEKHGKLDTHTVGPGIW